jgi:hypothetical protein
MLKKLTSLAAVALLLALAAIVATPPAHADRTYTLCDPARSTLCSGLVALYEFNETTVAGDVLRRSEVPAAPLVEAVIARGANVAQTASGKLGYALDHAASAGDGLYISRTAPFTGQFTFTFWIYLGTAPSSDGKMSPIFWMAPEYSSTEYILNGSAAPSTGANGTHPMVYLSRTSTNTTIKYEVQQGLTETVTPVTSGVIHSGSPAWHHIALGQYPSATSSYPYRRTIWIAVDGGSKTLATIDYPDYGKPGHFAIAGMPAAAGSWEYCAFRLDQFGIWDRTLLDSEIDVLYGGGSGVAYPFYTP